MGEVSEACLFDIGYADGELLSGRTGAGVRMALAQGSGSVSLLARGLRNSS